MTSATIKIYDESNHLLCTLYVHGDGGVSETGAKLLNFVKSKKVVNGLPSLDRSECRGLASTMSDLAAQTVHHFKQSFPVGWVYLVVPNYDTPVCYEYKVTFNGWRKNANVYVKFSGKWILVSEVK